MSLPIPIRKLINTSWQFMTGREPFELKYAVSRARNRISPIRPFDADVVFVTPPGKDAWILHAICREIDTYTPRNTLHVPGNTTNAPHAPTYFFSHYLLFQTWLLNFPQVARAKNVVWFTHPKDIRICPEELTYVLNQAHHTFSSCDIFTNYLKNLGVCPGKVTTAIPGADPEMFRPHVRRHGAVGFCSTYVPRKNPERILDIVQACPTRDFILLGRNWEHYERFSELREAANFTYMELPYAEYPSFYESIDVLVSPSRLEGGPIPVLEAMMSNVVPVASQTGFAEDLIVHGENGYIFDVDAPVSEIVDLIELACLNQVDTRVSVEHFTWERYSHEIQSKFDDFERPEAAAA